MIERGRREHPELTLRLNLGAELPEPDESADAVVCCAVLTCIPEASARERVLGEIERVLRPGGVVHVVEFAEGGGRSYDAEGRFKSGFGIEMVHFTRQRLLTELGRFQEIGIREFDCRSVSGSPERAFACHGRKRVARRKIRGPVKSQAIL
jgi:ubiquinone/menaquinone biosynthesis C-methylase UbiE